MARHMSLRERAGSLSPARWDWNPAHWAREREEPEYLKGAVAGLIGGLVGTIVMTAAQTMMARAAKREGSEDKARHPRVPEVAYTEAGISQSAEYARERGGDGEVMPGAEQEEPATEKAAEAISGRLLGYELSERQRARAGSVIHYGFGTAVGGVYGVLAEASPAVTIGAGAPFGAAVWLLVDEGAVPALGWTDPPHRRPVSAHAKYLLMHLVYGTATEAARRLARRLL